MTVKKRLGEMLLEAGVIDETQLHAALGHQRKWGGKLGQALLDLKLATEPQVVAALSRKFGYNALNVAALPRTAQLEAALKLIPRELALRQTLLPVATDSSSITVAMADPSNISVVDELSFRTGRRIKIVLAGDREIASAVRRFYYADEEPSQVTAIPFDEPSSDTPFETTGDPFAAMPDYMRNGSLNQPFHAPAREAERGGGQSRPALEPPPASPPPLPAAATRPPAARVNAPDAFTPPPVLLRGAAAAPAPPGIASARGPVPGAPAPRPATAPARPVAPLAPLASSPEDVLGEPILATDLAPIEDDEPSEGSSSESRLTPRQSAMLDALERAARGEESGLVKPAHLAAVLARLLLRRGIVSEQELLEELTKK